MFVQSEKFVVEHGGRLNDLSIYGQESNSTTRRLAIMNLAIRGIEADFGPEHADTFRRDLHKDLKAQFVIANPPFNDSDWHRGDDDVRWQYGVPPKGNANFAWVQHFIHHLAPDGFAGFVLANGSMSSNQSGEGEIRQKLVQADLSGLRRSGATRAAILFDADFRSASGSITKNKERWKASGPAQTDPVHRCTKKLGNLIDRVHLGSRPTPTSQRSAGT